MAPTAALPFTDQAALWQQAISFGNMKLGLPKACALYARISPKPKENREVAALDRQLYEDQETADRLGWPVVETFVDQHVSAYSRKPRPEYERLKEWVADGRIDAVITWRTDRLHRRPTELGDFLDMAQKYRLQLASPHGEEDITTPAGRMWLWMQAVWAQGEIEKMRDRLFGMYRQKARDGEPWATVRPFGYEFKTLPDGKLTYVQHPDEGPMVRDLYRLLLAGTPQAELVRRLNDAGFTTTSEMRDEDGNVIKRPWVQGSLRNFLLHPRNAGLRTYRSTEEQYSVPLHEAPHADGNWSKHALVDKDTYEAAKSIITGGPLNNLRRGTALLSGIAVCGYCKRTVTTKLRRSRCSDCRGKGSCPHTEPKRAYVCQWPDCGKIQRDAAFIDAAAVESLLARLEKPNAAQLLVPAEDQPAAEALYEEKVDLQTKITAWARSGATLGPEAVEAATTELRARLDVVERELRDIKTADTAALAGVMGPGARSVWAALDPGTDDGLARRRAIIRAARLNVVLVPANTKGRPPADPTLAAARRASTVKITFGGTR